MITRDRLYYEDWYTVLLYQNKSIDLKARDIQIFIEKGKLENGSGSFGDVYFSLMDRLSDKCKNSEYIPYPYIWGSLSNLESIWVLARIM